MQPFDRGFARPSCENTYNIMMGSDLNLSCRNFIRHNTRFKNNIGTIAPGNKFCVLYTTTSNNYLLYK